MHKHVLHSLNDNFLVRRDQIILKIQSPQFWVLHILNSRQYWKTNTHYLQRDDLKVIEMIKRCMVVELIVNRFKFPSLSKIFLVVAIMYCHLYYVNWIVFTYIL